MSWPVSREKVNEIGMGEELVNEWGNNVRSSDETFIEEIIISIGLKNESVKANQQPEVVQLRIPETGQHLSANGGGGGGGAGDRSNAGGSLSSINSVNKGSSVAIGQNGFYSYTDLPPKEFGHVSGKCKTANTAFTSIIHPLAIFPQHRNFYRQFNNKKLYLSLRQERATAFLCPAPPQNSSSCAYSL